MKRSIGRQTRRCALCFLALAGCAPESLVDVAAPGTVVTPGTVSTPAGATQLYNYAVGRFAMIVGGNVRIIDNYIGASGLLTDELQSAGQRSSSLTQGVDERTAATISGVHGEFYQRVHATRIQQQQARDALRLFAPATPRAWQGQLQALEGYTLLMFAELFCSGIPLTSVPLLGLPQPTAGFSTQELFERAIGLFDSAIVTAADSGRFVQLAKVGKGRALLGLGRFADAAAAVQDVPTDFAYNLTYAALYPGGSPSHFLAGNMFGTVPHIAQVVDNEGGTGLNWSGDPRTAVTTRPSVSGAMRVTAKYTRNAAGDVDATVSSPATPIRLADGLEARLIEAEAGLAVASPTWLSILNTLRATCVGAATCAPVPGLTASSLPPLSDPGNAAARLDLVMSERALWLFLTGHRQGDLRRLARVYQRDPAMLYPRGTYLNAGFPPLIAASSAHGTLYGTDVVFVPAADEARLNPLYGGCFDTNP